jgi:dipeptidyl aminopeptidase/acylaminoacyl peptidase
VNPIPLSLVQAGRDLTEPRLSPDGTRVAFVQRWRSAAAICVVGLEEGSAERQLSFGPDPAAGRGFGGGCFTWLGESSDRIAYVGTEGQLWLQSGFKITQLTSSEQPVRAPRGGGVGSSQLVYIVGEAEVWKIDVDSGALQRLDDGRHEFCFDPSISPDGATVSWQAWSPPLMPWDGSVRVDLEVQTGVISEVAVANAAVQQPRFTPRGESAHVHDGSGWLNVYVGDRAVVAEPVEHAGPTWGMGNRSYVFDDGGGRMAFTRNEGGHGALCVVDLSTGEVEQLGRGVHGHLTWVGNNVVALRSGARTPPQIVRYAMGSGARTTIAYSQPEAWPTGELPEPELFTAPARDGETQLHARRFAAGNGRMLAWVHGGPTDQWQVEWRPRIAYWWSRGWDVLVVDPRGTTGHGRTYQQALHGGWGRIDTDDVADLIRHAQAQGWAAPESSVVMGGSSGGLTVLAVLTDYPELVAGGVASYPVSDLKALTEATHRFEAHYTDTLVAPNDGSPESDAAFRELSPLHRAQQIRSKLLLFHGTEDPVVPISQSDDLVDAVRAAGGSVDYIEFQGEGHGFRQPANVAEEYSQTEAFLERVTQPT